MTKRINIPIKIHTYRNSCMFDTRSQILVKISNYEDIQMSKTFKSDFLKTWRGKRQNI